MPYLEFRGKQSVYSHHLTIPVKALEINARKSLSKGKGKPATLEDNLILHADNLHAMKALLPHVGGKVNCIYIDPPYNTGNEDWEYNDNVNSPLMKQWLADGPVGAEDLGRHDKWLCMMWPRLQLMKELLAEDGAIFVSIDDHEMGHLKLLMDEIFGGENLVANIIWRKKSGGGQDATYFAREHEYILCYRKSDAFKLEQIMVETNKKDYKTTINGRFCKLIKLERWGIGALKSDAPSMHYPIKDPDGNHYYPKAPNGNDGRWRKRPETLDAEHLHWRRSKDTEGWIPYEVKYYDEEPKTRKQVPRTIVWNIASTADATREQLDIFGKKKLDNSKPVDLIRFLLRQATGKNALVLDAFAGTGTTGHAVLNLNEEDGGSRRFLLIESEKHADTAAAERIRRVIKKNKGGGGQLCLLRPRGRNIGRRNARGPKAALP